MMQGFLKDAAEKQDADERIREWISQVRDIAYDADDVIDTFIQKVRVEGTPKRGFLTSVKEYSCICNKASNLYGIGKEIEALKNKVAQISRRRVDYGIRNIGDAGQATSSTVANWKQLRLTRPYADDEEVVGFDDVTDSLIDALLKKEPRRCVISIWGTGGLGKTTLARKIYHHSKLEGKFEHRGWICVSQEYRIQDLLQSLIKSFKPPTKKDELELLEKMTVLDLEHHLREILEGCQYLVVIDDVWEVAAWQNLRRAFPDNRKGSQVIVTTRIKAIAERSDERTHVHELRFLSSNESWKLFCKKAFCNHNATDGDMNYLSSFETMGREMVEKCRGLPLAIIVLGGLLSRKHPDEWRKVKEHMWRVLSNDSKDILPILTLSFNDLPNELKLCFLYLGIFPEDFEFRTEMLIRMWVAEGFIPQEDKETLEEIAENWLNELIGRSLIQVVVKSRWGIVTCRVHDLLRDFAVTKGKEQNFLHTYDGNINEARSSSTTSSSHRRHAVHSLTIERYVSINNPNSRLRTLSFFNSEDFESNDMQLLKSILTRFKLLRVLNLQGFTFSYDEKCRRRLPDAVGELIHLRYLGLRGTEINEIPPSIANLHDLQTLDVYIDGYVKLPGNFCKLKRLRHLFGMFEWPLEIEHLTELQTVMTFIFESRMDLNLKNLTNLRKLEIETRGAKKFTLDCIANFRNLQSFSIVLGGTVRPPSYEPLSHCQHLTQLMIDGKIGEMPEQMHEYLPNLKCLVLRKSGFSQDPIPTLEKLPNLQVLEIREEGKLEKLSFSANGFCQLDMLILFDCWKLKVLEVEEGAMPMITSFDLKLCQGVDVVPQRLSSVWKTQLPSFWELEKQDSSLSYNDWD